MVEDDLPTQCGAYIKHRIPELSHAQARDAATMALDWLRQHLAAKHHNDELDELERLFERK